MNPVRSSSQSETEPKRFLLSRSFLLGAIAGSLETLLALTTGIMPPLELGLNFLLLIAAFGGVGGVCILARRSGGLAWIDEDTTLLLASIVVFSLRGCLHNCGDDAASRLVIPTVITVVAMVTRAVLQRTWPRRKRGVLILVAASAMTAAALDFARRDGIQIQPEFLVEILAPMAFVGAVSAAIAGRGWLPKLAWTLALGLGAASWALYESRPLGLQGMPRRANDVAGHTRPQKPNVVLVVMDTVRADHLSLYGYRRRTSPNLEAIAKESLVFDHAIASGNYSLPSHASLFTGLLPSLHGAHKRKSDLSLPISASTDFAVSSDVPTVAETLRASGYATGGLSANWGYLARWTGLQRGFMAFDDRPYRQMGFHPALVPIVSRVLGITLMETLEWNAPSVTRSGLAFAASSTTPFFLFLNYFDAHAPYVARLGHGFRGDGLGSDDRSISAYDSEIAYLDAALGDLVAGLRQGGVLDNTILIITADHGEFFGEHDFRLHRVGGYEPVLHVPLIIRYPARLQPKRVPTPFGLHEVPRLITDLLDERPVDWAYAETSGPKVLAQLWGRVAAADRPPAAFLEPDAHVVYEGSHKLIARKDGKDELYELASDPLEERDLVASPDGGAARRRLGMRAAVASLPPPRPGTDATLDTEDLAALRGLGYLSFRRQAPKRP